MRCIIICNMHREKHTQTRTHSISPRIRICIIKYAKSNYWCCWLWFFFASTPGNRHHISAMFAWNGEPSMWCIMHHASVYQSFIFIYVQKMWKMSGVGRSIPLRVNLRKFVQSTPFESNWLKCLQFDRATEKIHLRHTLTNMKEEKRHSAESFQFNQ